MEDRYSGVLSPLVDGLESVLKTLQSGLEVVGVPYAYGWSIVLLTVLVKVLTYPLTKQQVGLYSITTLTSDDGPPFVTD